MFFGAEQCLAIDGIKDRNVPGIGKVCKHSNRNCSTWKRKKAGKNTRSVCCCFPKLKTE